MYLQRVRQRVLPQTLIYFCAFLLLFVILFPFYWLSVSSIKVLPELYAENQTLFPRSFTLDSYRQLLVLSPFLKYYLNSLIISSGTVFIALILSIGAGYSIGRLRYPGRRTVSRLIVAAYIFPGILLLIPLYLLMTRLHLNDDLLSLVIIYTTVMAPYATWLLKAYFTSIPAELEEAAMVDGASRLRSIWSVVLPLAKPGIVATSIYIFIMSWSEYMFAAVMITSDRQKTIPLGLVAWLAQYHIEWGVVTAGAVMTAIPVLLFFVLIGRAFVSGLLGGAMKG